MKKNINMIKNSNKNLIILGYLILLIVFLIIYINYKFSNNSYDKFKAYEMEFISQEKIIEKDIEEAIAKYASREISKRVVRKISYSSSKQFEEMYDDFRWNKGNKRIKELCALRKEIYILKSQKYNIISNTFPENNNSEIQKYESYIGIFTNRYDEVEKEERK